MEYTRYNPLIHIGIQVCNPTRNFIITPCTYEPTPEEIELNRIKQVLQNKIHIKQMILFCLVYFLLIVPLLVSLLIGMCILIQKFMNNDLGVMICMGWGIICSQLAIILWMALKEKMVNDWYY